MSSLKQKLKQANKAVLPLKSRNPCANTAIMSKGGVHTADTIKHKHRQSRRDSKKELKSGNWF